MAKVEPKKIPSRASKGERLLFALLQKLPDDVVFYYEPEIDGRYPDFVVILPSLGILTLEVKGWFAGNIVYANSHEVRVKENSVEVVHKHPLRQVREYQHALMDTCRTKPGFAKLANQAGLYQGKFEFPFGYGAVLSNITREQLRNHSSGCLPEVFKRDRVANNDDLTEWEKLSPQEFLKVLQGFFNPWWPTRLSPLQVDVLRGIIHPEAVLYFDFAKSPEQEVSLRILDLAQEAMARNVGDGHRLVFGVAGSGKTVVLIARAKLLAETNSRGQVLVLCFNLARRLYLSQALANLPNVKEVHFHAWAKANIRNTDWTGKDDNAALGRGLLEALKNGARDAGHFDAVLIDEAQDFCSEWFQCALLALKDSANSDLFIVGDASQGVYGKRKVSWKQLGIQAQGRTNYLEENYRNTRPILEVARLFSSKQIDDGEDGISAPVVDPSRAKRLRGPVPTLVQAVNLEAECLRAAEIAARLISGHWFGQQVTPLRPEEIGILYRSGKGPKWELLSRLRDKLNASNLPTVWLTENLDARHRMGEKALKITTVHGSKGLQFRAVLFIFAGECPDLTGGNTEDEERRLFYVALTRAEDYLALTWSRDAGFITDIKASGKARNV
jgi:hypothetical protein